jgi:hypothetical protein
MTKTRTAWLAFALLASVSISAVVAMTASTWQTPATVEAAPDESVAQIEPADDSLAKPTTTSWPDVSTHEAVDPPPPLILRGAELPAEASPPAPVVMPPERPTRIMNITGRHWHDANAGIKLAGTQQMPGANAQQIKRARDSKAEMRVKRSKAAASVRACAPPSNGFAGLLRKLNLSPRCPA